MKKNKKGVAIENIFLAIAPFIGFIVFIIFYFGQQKIMPNYIGEYQFKIADSVNQVEKAIMYLDHASKYSFEASIAKFSRNGAFYSKPDCGLYYGSNLWISGEEKGSKVDVTICAPSIIDAEENLKETFDEKLSIYLESNPDAYFPMNYDYTINEQNSETEINVISKEPLVVPIGMTILEFAKSQKSRTNRQGTTQYTTSRTNNQNQQVNPILQPLKVPKQKGVDIETIRAINPNVLANYEALCKEMKATSLFGQAPYVCSGAKYQCCITDGYRSSKYNSDIGGAKDSAHLYGLALDIYVGNYQEQLKWAKVASKYFTRVGIYPGDSHIHVDMLPVQGASNFYWIGKGGTTIASSTNLGALDKTSTA